MEYLVTGMAMLLLTIPAWAGTMTDNFNDGSIDGWVQDGNGIWGVENGELVFQSQVDVSSLSIGELNWQDYTVGVRAKIVKHQVSPGFSEIVAINVRVLSKTKSYVFGMGTPPGSDVKQVEAFYVDGNITMMKTVSKPFDWKLNTWYDLKVVVKGSRFEFYVDNALILEYTDETHPMGKVALSCGIQSTSAHFDDFFVTGDDIVPDITAVSGHDKLATTWGEIRRAK